MAMHCTAFTYRELKWLLDDAGLKVYEVYGCAAGNFGTRPLTVEDGEIMVIAKKI